jgi:thiamine kinase-like enzyme
MSSATRLLDQEFTAEVCYDLLPEWRGAEVRISALSGGITNKLYRVQSERGDVTVRIYGDKTDLFINRDEEAHTIQEMSKLGVASRLVKYMPEKGVTIVDFIGDSIVLNNRSFLDEALHEKIVAPIRKIHDSGIRLNKIFNPLVEVMRMSAILRRLSVSYPEFEIAGTIERLIKLSSVINIPESEYAPCHNDLLADNFILINEDARDRYDAPMYLIDWEYAGMAPRFYDIADMFQEILAPRETEKSIVEAYCRGGNFDRTLFMIDMFKPFPDIYWFLWSLIQLNVSKISFDYYTYGKVKYENALQNLSFLGEAYGAVV